MPFDINVAFNVQTQELVNARNALQSLTQAARELNTNQDKAVKTAEKLVDVNEKLAESASSASKAAERSEKATKSLAGEGDAAATKLARLKDQLSFLRDDLSLSEVGFTKSQAGVLSWAKSVGATNDIIKQFANTFDNLNKVTGSNPFDQSTKGLSSLTREFYEIVAVQDLAASGFGLTAKQVQMLSRDIESLQQQNRAFGRDANDGVDKLRAEFLGAANSVNSYRDQIKAAQQANESLFKQEQELARHRNSANNEMMKTWADGVGKRSQAMEQLSAQYAQEAKAAASAEKVAADAIAYTDRETRRLIETNDLLSRGFTSSSANAIFKYKEALEKTGVSAIDLKQKLYLLEQDLAKRQGTSPFAKMREDIQKVTQQTNHLARAISVQLGDVAISLAGGQNPFVVLLQQGDQIRGAVQQAVDAGQSINKAMAGAFSSMFNSFKLVGSVVKEFAMDGLRSVGNSLNVVANQMVRNNSINKQFADGTITATRHARLLEQASLQNAKALGTLRLVALGTSAAFAVTLVAAYVSLSKEQDAVAKSNAQFGASFGASTQEALAMARGLREFGVNTETAITAMSGLMKSGNIGKESFEGITLAAANAQKWVGVSIDETVKKFNDLADDPMKVLREFTAQTGYLSQSQLQLVRGHLEAGDAAKAQAVAVELLQDGLNQMSTQAQKDMSALGRAMVELGATTNTLWDQFKKSYLVEASLKVVKAVIDVVAVSAHALVSVVRDLAITAGFAIDLVSDGPRSVSDKWDTYTKALAENAENHNKWSETLINGTQAQEGLTAAQRAGNASAEQVTLGISKMAKANEENVKSLAKSVDIQTYAAKRLEEDNKAITKNFTEAQKKAFFESEQYRVQALASEKRFQKEWTDANKKSQKTASETYKAVRDNTIVETKKFYDTQLKALQDYESKQSQVNKSSYDSRAISLGEYLAKELQLVASSQKQQLDILKTSEAVYLSNVEARKQVLAAAAKEAISKGGNAAKIMEKLAQDIENLDNSTKSSTEAFKTQREALENATNAKYAKFYEEIAKTINSSKDALEKFNETISDNARKRSESLDEQRTLLDLHGREAAAYKASRSAMSAYSGEIRESKKALEEATKALSDFNETTAFDDTSSFEQYKILVENKTQAEKRFIETTSQAQKDSNQAAADAMLEYNLGVFKEIRDSLSESVYNAIFEGGGDGGKALKDSLKKMFKNYVINVVLNPIMNQVTGLLGIGGAGGGAVSSGGGILGTASNLSSLYNSFSGGLVSSIGGAVGSLGSLLGSSALTSFASGMAGITGAGAITGAAAGTGLGLSASAGGLGLSAGGGLGLTAGAGAASSVGAGAAGAASAGSAFAAAVPWVAAAVALYSIAKSFDDSGTLHYGAGAVYSGGKLQTGADIYNRDTFGMGSRGEWNANAQQNASGIAASLGAALDGFAIGFGQKAGYTVATAFADDSSDDGAWGSLRIADAMGSALVDWENSRSSKWAPKEFASGDEGYQQYLAAVAVDVKSAFLAMDIPAWSKQIVAAATDLDSLSAALTSIGQIKSVFDSLGKTMAMFKDITSEMQTSLLESLGGMGGLSSAASAFYEGFYSEEERIKIAGDNINAALKEIGVSLDVFGGEAVKADFRKAVEEAFSTDNTGLASALLAISGSFAEVTDAAQAAGSEVEKVAISFWEAYAKLAEKAGYTGSVRAYNADVLAVEIKSLFQSLGIDKDIGILTTSILNATKQDVEDFFKQLWPLMQTGEAKSNLIDIGDALLDIVESGKGAEQALQDLTNSIVSELTAAFDSMNSAANILQKIEAALTGSSSGLVREQKLWESISTSNYRKQIELAGELSDIILSRYQAEQQNAQKLLAFGKSLQAYVNGLKIGNLSTLTPAEKLAEAGKQYADTLEKAQAGDEAAKSALQGSSSAYLELARQYFASSDDYTKIFGSVTGSLDALGIKSQSEAQMQLEVSSDSLNELRKLEVIVKQAHQTAKTDFSIQKSLLHQQIDQMLRTADGIEKVQSLLAGLPYDISSQFNTGGTSGVTPSDYNALAQQYIDIMGSKTPSTDVGYVSSYMASADSAKWSEEYYNAMALLQKQEDRDRLADLFNRLAIINGIKVNGSHKNGLDNVPFDGYVAKLHKDERVLTAQENKAYTPSMSANGNTGMSVMASEIRSLNARIDKLTTQNERLMLAQIRATVESNNSSSERVVEGITKATEKATYANTIEKGYK